MNDNAKLDSKISRLFTDILWLRFTLDSLAFNGIYRLFQNEESIFMTVKSIFLYSRESSCLKYFYCRFLIGICLLMSCQIFSCIRYKIISVI